MQANDVLPLSALCPGQIGLIHSIRANPSVAAHLRDLGAVVGASVTVITSFHGNLIVQIKDTRLALGVAMAQRIYIQI